MEELKKRLAKAESEKETYKTLVDEKRLKEANRETKDRLFKFIFGNPENKIWTLSLYNAINGTNYTNPDELVFNTIEDVVYMRMKNDMSFIVSFEMNLWEGQSSFNPNMPLRFLVYAGALYDKYTATSKYNKFSSKLQSIPRPKCICFYNGKMEQPEKKILKLSDAYDGNGDIEVLVTMLNINYGKNKKLMDACKPLKEYAWLVDKIRKYQEKSMDLDSAIDRTIDEMPEDFLIKKFLVGNRAEVKMMLLTEYDEEKHIKMEREEAWEEGREFEMANTLKEKSRADALEKELSDALEQIKELKSRLNNGVKK
ncbi:MAG: hypothetical protein IKP88_20685 [Lachnospiraceae bacterium]|nr:hypothetical protein [Lachnospiraceae bacterium]